MKGGEDKFNIPEYKEPTNNPMISNEQKRIYNENKPKFEKQDQKPPANQILNLQLYQPPKPKPKQDGFPNPAVFYPNYVQNPYNPAGYMNFVPSQPVYKEYNININGVGGSHISTAMIYEDAMPIKNISNTYSSLGERITMYEYIRSIIFSNGDGKDVPIEDDRYNLLSHLKFMDMNPYSASRFSGNPYKGLPLGFLLYRSCYPIRHDPRNLTAMCAPNSTGINVRIYRMTEGSYYVNKQAITKTTDYDEWRDIAFYNFVKEDIIKKKVSPNFTIMYGYNITLNSNINFDQLKILRGRQQAYNNPFFLRDRVVQATTVQVQAPLPALYAPASGPPPVPVATTYTPLGSTGTAVSTTAIQQTGIPIDVQLVALNKYAGKALVCLTEASNYSILGWAKKEYRAVGNIKKMINTGYHPRNVWESIIFQLMATMYVLQIKKIVINNFSIGRNIFIKDISLSGNVTNYWKYKINGIEYYIPNHGYLLLLDTNFRDFDQILNCVAEIDPNRERKIDGKFLGTSLSDQQIIDKTFEMFRTAIDPNTFNQDFVNDNGIKPPEEVQILLQNIKNDVDAMSTKDISYYIRKYMTMFMNNRIGTMLTAPELAFIKSGGVKEFRNGQIVVMPDAEGTNKFVLHVETTQNGLARIITSDQNNTRPDKSNLIEKEVPVTSLNEFSVVEPIKQIFKVNESNLSEEALIETYTVA